MNASLAGWFRPTLTRPSRKPLTLTDRRLLRAPSVPGVATGLAWTPVGGEILFIEATRTLGTGRQILTGHLGEVMRESAQAALSIVKNRAGSFGIEASGFEKIDIHIHVPTGAIAKDGPSAGVAMFMALVSLMTERTVRNDTAMTFCGTKWRAIEMKEHETRRKIIREWLKLPKDQRRTEEQVTAFARMAVQQNEFDRSRRDPYEKVIAWLLPRINRS